MLKTGIAKVLIPVGNRMKLIYMDRESEEYRKFSEYEIIPNSSARYSKHVKYKYYRLKKSHSTKKVTVILAFEDYYDLHTSNIQDFTLFYKKLKKTVNFWVNIFSRRWSKWRLSAPDFESVFWEEAWFVIDNYDYWETYYYLYETLELSFRRRGLDVVRKATKTKQGRFEHGAGRLPEWLDKVYPGTVNTEKTVLNRMLIGQMFSEPSLTDQERKLLEALSENYDASYEELAIIMGLKHKTEAWRLLKSIRMKLEKYREDALSADIDAYKWQYKEPDQRKLSWINDTYEDDEIIDSKPEDGFKTAYKQHKRKNTTKIIKAGLILRKTRKKLKLKSPTAATSKPVKVKKRRIRKSKNRRKDPVISYPPDFDPTSIF